MSRNSHSPLDKAFDEHHRIRSSDLSSPVVGLHLVGRLTSGRFCWVCLITGEFLQPQGAIPPDFYLLRGGYCMAPEAPQKRECRQGQRYFWPCWMCVGFGLATGPTLKTALCHIRALVGRMINNQNHLWQTISLRANHVFLCSVGMFSRGCY